MKTCSLCSRFNVARAVRKRARVGAVVLIAALFLMATLPVARAASTSAPAPMLQFTSAGHIIGFAPTQVILAALDHALRVEFVGTAGVMPVASGAETASSSDGLTMHQAQPLGVVTYPELWRGVTVEYRASEGLALSGVEGSIVKSTYHLAPGADVAQIRLRYNVPVQVQSDGSLEFPFGRGYLSESAPIAWQEIDGARVPVQVAFQTCEVSETSQVSTIGFRLGAYDPRYPLTIDPNYVWHTFYGSSNVDNGYGIAVDGSGNVYVTGDSAATWQGDGGANPRHAHSGNNDIVVVKLTSAGAYQWHTFYGSGSADRGYGIAVDGSGNVYVTGYSKDTWQGDGGTNPLHAHSGSGYYNIVVVKLTSVGAYQWHTFYGSVSDEGHGIAVDGSGNVYVTGHSYTTWQGDGGTNPLHLHSGGYDIVALKLTSAGAYQWHTFYGSGSADRGYGIAVDGTGSNVYVTGYSDATWQGDGGTNPLHAHSGGSDIVALKLTSAGAYQWHTFYGSSSSDYGYGIAVDGSSNVYVTGHSDSTWQGDGGTNPLHAHSGIWDIVALKLTSAGAYQWHTFYGSSNDDNGYGIAVDGSGNVYVTGDSAATWLGDGSTNPLHAYSGGWDIVVLKLTSAGAFQWHTFYGSSNSDYGNGIAVDGTGSNVYVTSYSYTTWQGNGDTNPLHAHSGNYDIVVLKLSSVPTAVTLSSFRATTPTFDWWQWLTRFLGR